MKKRLVIQVPNTHDPEYVGKALGDHPDVEVNDSYQKTFTVETTLTASELHQHLAGKNLVASVYDPNPLSWVENDFAFA